MVVHEVAVLGVVLKLSSITYSRPPLIGTFLLSKIILSVSEASFKRGTTGQAVVLP